MSGKFSNRAVEPGVTTTLCLSIGMTLLAGCGQSQTTNPQNTTNQASTTHRQQNPNLKSAVAYIKGEKSAASISGAASLTVDKKLQQLTVVVELSGLTPKHKYILRVADHSEATVYGLKAVQADLNGSGTCITRVNGVDDISSKWAVHVMSSDSKTPIAAGKVQSQNP